MNISYKLVALLPMKAHSARVSGKNFRSFANKPLFKWVLDVLLSIGEIDLVIINTDARRLLEESGFIASDKVLIRDRPIEICGDLVSMNRIIENDVQNVDSEIYLMTHTTNPLITESTIRKAISTYREGALSKSYDSLFSVNRFQTRFYRADATPVNHNPEILTRTQDLEPWFEENSNLYVFNKESFGVTGSRIGLRPILFETPPLESVDIDDQSGWNLAEIIALQRQLAQVGR